MRFCAGLSLTAVTFLGYKVLDTFDASQHIVNDRTQGGLMSSASDDRALGMGRQISRRDFVNGAGAAAAGALLLPNWALAAESAQDYAPEQAAAYYPPALTGMRGDHAGSFEVAHALRDRRAFDLSAATHTGETYDLVVVGAGMSGLAAAYYFQKNVGRGAKVLILDNHDDFGGHAKRNEFRHEGKLLAVNGGTLNIEAPFRYFESSPSAKSSRDAPCRS